MRLLKLFEKRKSVREYREKVIAPDVMGEVIGFIDNLPAGIGSGVEFEIINAKEEVDYSKLEGVVGYYGKVIKAPYYLAVLGESTVESAKIAGYLGEWLILHLTKIDLGTCWVDVGDNGDKVKEILELETPKKVLSLIAFGYPNEDRRVSHIFDNPKTASNYPNINISFAEEPVSVRKSIADIAYNKKWGNAIDVDGLKELALDEVLFYMRLAPSWGNRQPWMFVLDGMKIVLTIKKDLSIPDVAQEIEAGIAMLYFEVAMHNQGLPGKWNLDLENMDLKKLEIPSEYYVAGYYTY